MTRYDLAELYMKLRNYEKAEKIIGTALEQQKGKISRKIVNLRGYFMLFNAGKQLGWAGKTVLGEMCI